MKIVTKWLVMIICFFMILLLTFNLWALFQKKYANNPFPMISGWSYAVVRSDSMSPTFSKGAVLIIHEEKDYEVNDIITFLEPGDSISTTHRLIKKENERYITKGDANQAEDFPLKREMIYGKVTSVIPLLGLIILIFQNKLVIVLFFGLIVLYQMNKKIKEALV